MTSIRVYLACPYWHEDEKIRKKRFESVNKMAGKLIVEGRGQLIIFSPISHSVPISYEIGSEQDHELWLGQDGHFVDWADQLWVLALDGWKESYGVNWEINRALDQGKIVRIIRYEI